MSEELFEEQKDNHIAQHRQVENDRNSENGDIDEENTTRVAQNANEAQSTT